MAAFNVTGPEGAAVQGAPRRDPPRDRYGSRYDDSYRNVRFKMTCCMPDGPFLLRKMVPGNKPVILGKGILYKPPPTPGGNP